MAIEASAILPADSLEELRIQFNNLVSDVDGITGGNSFVSSIIFEGSTADANETTLTATDPTADRIITIPDATGTMVTTGNAAVGTTTTSIGDVDHVLVNDGGVLKKITASNLVAGTASPVAADNITVGDSAVSIATSAGNITIDAQEGDTDIIFKGTDSSSDITALTLDMSDAGKAIFNGAISATTITLSADGGVIVPDDGNIGSASSTAAMQISSGGIVTFVDDIKIKDGGTIGVASAADAMTVSAAGIVTFKDDILIKDGGTIGVASAATAMTISAAGIVTFVDDILIKDGGTIGVASSTSAITIASSGIVTLVDDLLIKDGGTIGVASSTSAITIASSGIVTLVDDLLIKDGGTIGAASSTGAITIASSGIVTFVDDILIKDGGTIGVASSTSAITISSGGIVTLVDDLLLKDACTIGTATTAGAISIAADGLVNLATAAATVNSAVIRTAGTDTIWIPAAAMRPTSSNGCAAITDIETTSGRPDMQVLDFDPSSDEHAQFQISMPKSWNEGTITAQFYWTTTATDTDGVSWAIQGVCVSDNDTIDVAYGTAIVVDDSALGAAEDLCVTAATGAITIGGSPAAGDLAFFRVFRDVSDSNDDMGEDARLIGVKIFFTTNAATDA
mgnify:FL=1